jgi:hypothetical protein
VQAGTFPDAAHSFGSAPKQPLAVETGNKPVISALPHGYGPASEES